MNSYYVIGVMSGTSLDGVDLCYVRFDYSSHWSFEILKTETIPYDDVWVEQLKKAIHLPEELLSVLNEDYTSYLGQLIMAFVKTNAITRIDAVCSHGHTVSHQPENKLTVQIGNLPQLASMIEQTVVCDFRVQDVMFGGQGAPLVPIGDKFLFHDYDFCLNLGGFANASFEFEEQRIAYDICPVNIVLNHYISSLGFSYDNNGELAASGKLDETLFKTLNDLEFYKKSHPKSLGLEWVELHVFPLIDAFNLKIKDVLCTFVEHAAFQIGLEINKLQKGNVLITGGGVFNSFLMERIIHYSKREIIIPSAEIIDNKEALIFGFLGVLKLRDEVNCLSSVTGARVDHSSGNVFHP